MRKTVVAFGELLWDLLPGGKVLGGATTNFIFRINLFGDHGFLISRVGKDKDGEEAREILTKLGLAVHYIQTDPTYPTGTVPVVLDEKGIPVFTITPGVAYDHIVLRGAMLPLLKQADCIYYGTLIQRTEQSRNTLYALLAEAPRALKFLDLNLRKDCYSVPVIDESIKAADILKINDEELLLLKDLTGIPGDSLQGLAHRVITTYPLKLILVTLGEKGAFILTDAGRYLYDPGYQVEVIDTVGSGDACSAGFMHCYLNGHSPEESLKFGNAAGALVAATKGGTEIITKDDVIRFMHEKQERISIED
ncbi:MAG: PfkB family carbohydrate kinase [Mangrovibacterium sp.]|nr:PfkB family carbohydrate kinase [Mangrovibacterium sp.]